MCLIRSISFAAILGTLALLGLTDLIAQDFLHGSVFSLVAFGGVYSASTSSREGWKQFCLAALIIYTYISVGALTHFSYSLAIPYGVLAWVAFQEFLLPKLWIERRISRK